MEGDRRDVFSKIGMLGATTLAFVGVSGLAKADHRSQRQNPLLGLWDLTIPPSEGFPALRYKYAISEGGYVATGDQDDNVAVAGFKYSPTMGTYAQTGPNSYRLREISWAVDASGKPAGSTDFTGSAIVAVDGKSFHGSGTYLQHDLSGKVVLTQPITYTAVRLLA